MAHRFTVIFEKEADRGYHVLCPTLPGCHTQSETIEERHAIYVRQSDQARVVIPMHRGEVKRKTLRPSSKT
jgi:hypothetical protein